MIQKSHQLDHALLELTLVQTKREEAGEEAENNARLSFLQQSAPGQRQETEEERAVNEDEDERGGVMTTKWEGEIQRETKQKGRYTREEAGQQNQSLERTGKLRKLWKTVLLPLLSGCVFFFLSLSLSVLVWRFLFMLSLRLFLLGSVLCGNSGLRYVLCINSFCLFLLESQCIFDFEHKPRCHSQSMLFSPQFAWKPAT